MSECVDLTSNSDETGATRPTCLGSFPETLYVGNPENHSCRPLGGTKCVPQGQSSVRLNNPVRAFIQAPGLGVLPDR